MQITIRFVALFVTNNYLEKALIGCYIKEVLFWQYFTSDKTCNDSKLVLICGQ